MTKFVYLAGPIAGCDQGEANDWRAYVSARLAYGVIGISPLRCEPPDVDGTYKLKYDCPMFGQPRAIASKNMLDVQQCDLVLAYFPEPVGPNPRLSIGTIVEIAWAHAIGKQTILVSRDTRVDSHPLIGFCVNWTLGTLDEAIKVCNGILGGYTGGKNV